MNRGIEVGKQGLQDTTEKENIELTDEPTAEEFGEYGVRRK